MMTRTIAVLPGDGIGPEVTEAALRVLETVAPAFGIEITAQRHPFGWAGVLAAGTPLPEATLEACRSADAVFLGAVGSPEADAAPSGQRPEEGLLTLRQTLGCTLNLRPLRLFDGLLDASPLRPERVQGVDLLVVRELGGGLYYGEPRGRRGSGEAREGFDTLRYSASEVRRVARAAFAAAATRRGRVTSVDKANVLHASALWREVVTEEGTLYPGIELEHMLVDRAAMEIVLNPGRFDVIVTSNLFGDILSDAAGAVAGSLGLLPSASLGSGVPIFEPVHGSAPDLAGRGIASPVGAILSAGMLLEFGFGAPSAARAIDRSLATLFEKGVRTPDLAPDPSWAGLGTSAFTAALIEEITRTLPLTAADREPSP